MLSRNGELRANSSARHSLIELDNIQAQLDHLRHKLSESAQAEYDPVSGSSELIRLIKEIIRVRRGRDAIFGVELFGEPAWDMLLELLLAELSQRRISVTSLSHGSAVPHTTALRWISTLEREGWVNREADKFDGRRVWITLTAKASAAMRTYLASCKMRTA